MSENLFFAKGKNRGNERPVILKTAVLLVNKAKEKRIKMKLSLPLNGRKQAGTPEWIVNAMTFVAQSHSVVSEEYEFTGYDIHFSDDNLFADAGAKASKCQMKGFTVQEVGNAESPDIDLQFVVYAPFSNALWKFCGQMGGEEFFAQFTQVEEPEQDLELSGDEEGAEEDEEETEGD